QSRKTIMTRELIISQVAWTVLSCVLRTCFSIVRPNGNIAIDHGHSAIRSENPLPCGAPRNTTNNTTPSMQRNAADPEMTAVAGASCRNSTAMTNSSNGNETNCGSATSTCNSMLTSSGTSPVADIEAPDTIAVITTPFRPRRVGSHGRSSTAPTATATPASTNAEFKTHPHGEHTSTGPVTSIMVVHVAAPAALIVLSNRLYCVR